MSSFSWLQSTCPSSLDCQAETQFGWAIDTFEVANPILATEPPAVRGSLQSVQIWMKNDLRSEVCSIILLPFISVKSAELKAAFTQQGRL
jgi:hypothetical protein